MMLNVFVGFVVFMGGVKREDADVGRSSVFSRLSGAFVEADDDDDVCEVKVEKMKLVGLFLFFIVVLLMSVELVKVVMFGFFASSSLIKDILYI